MLGARITARLIPSVAAAVAATTMSAAVTIGRSVPAAAATTTTAAATISAIPSNTIGHRGAADRIAADAASLPRDRGPAPSRGLAALSTAGSPSRFPKLGLAVPGGDPAEFKIAADAGLKSTWARLYVNGWVPASLEAWPDAKAAVLSGRRLWLSLTLDVGALSSGTYDTRLTTFVKTLPAGTRLTTNHEPSNKTKHISPTMFAAAWNHAAAVITNASGAKVLTGPIEVQANVIRGGYLNGLNKNLVRFVGLDGYDGISGPQFATRTFEQVTAASFAYTVKLFPHAKVGFSEFNSSRTTGWAKWVTAALAWAKSVGADTAVLFTALDFWQESPGRFHRLAGKLAVSG